jgi:hypothetical protein
MKTVAMKKASKILVTVAAVIVACLGFVILESRTNVLHRAYDDLVLDNKNHYLPCERLPGKAEVLRVVQERSEIIEAIEGVNPRLAGVEIDSTTCPGKADLVFWYASHADRLEIEKIIGANTFFGIPYRLNNR